MDSDAILREPPVAGDELDTLLGALERERGYAAWKCGDLTSAGLRATLGPSSPEQLMAQWQAAVDRSRTLLAEDPE
jgi:hypothetical protein